MVKKRKAKKEYPAPEDPRLKRVKCIVFDGGTGFEFWQQYHNLCRCEQDCMGCTFQYADFGPKKPCWASLFFYTIDGIFTAFVDAHGAYVDYRKLEEYVFRICGMKPNPDNHTNSDNYHNHPAVLAASHDRRIKWMELEVADKQKQLEWMLR